MVNLLKLAILTVLAFYAVIGALFMHGIRYDYEQSIEDCREKITLYPEEEL